MPNPTKNFTSDHHVQPLLYSEQRSVDVSFSNKPSNAIDPARLLAGLPAFINSSDKTIKSRKTLVILQCNTRLWDNNKEYRAHARIHLLLTAGFSIYHYDHAGMLRKINKYVNFSDSKWAQDVLTVPNISELSEKLHIPADQISILNKSQFEDVIEGDDSDWEAFSPFETIDLSNHPISITSIKRLLNQHGHKIKSFTSYDYPNLHEISLALSDPLTVLSNLEELELNPGNSMILAEPLQAILAKVAHLKKLVLPAGSDLSRANIHHFNISELEELILGETVSPITTESLQAILTKTVRLKKLVLFNCHHLDQTSLHDLSLSELEELYVDQCNISAESLQAILTKAVQLKELMLLNCHHLDQTSLHDLSLSELKELYLDKHAITDESLQAILANAPTGLTIYEPIDNRIVDANTHLYEPTDDRTIDANTHLYEPTGCTVEQEFIGCPKSPEVKNIRHCSYNELRLNPDSTDHNNPFILKNNKLDLVLQNLPETSRSKNPLYNIFQQKEGSYYFGRFKMVLSSDWQPMPSVSSNEKLESYWLSLPDEVEIQKSGENHFHYIRLKNLSADKQQPVTIETLLYCPNESSLLYNTLPNEVKQIVNNCRGYRTDDLDVTSLNMTSQQYLEAIIQQRSGACRHRSVAFKYLMQQHCPDIPVQLITNNIHAYAEVYHQGIWVRCDLGGYPDDLSIKHTLLPEYTAYNNSEHELEAPEQVYHHTIASHGIRALPDYYQRIKNLVSLTLRDITMLPHHLLNVLDALDTLCILNSKLSAHDLNTFLRSVPTLKTLIIRQCQMTPAEFNNIHLSSLKQLEHVTLAGDFIPDLSSLKKVMQTAVTQPKWVIEADHLNTTEDTHPIDVTHEPVTDEPAPSGIENAAKTQPTIKFKSRVRKPPNYRYFPKTIKADLAAVLNTDWKKGLIESKDTEALRIALQLHCQKLNCPCFYIHHPDELSCAGHYIARDGFTGSVQKGPGGALYDFITQHHHNSVLIINFNLFSPADIARFNSILDEERMVDGVPVSANIKIIGLINPDNPDAYQGADFYSRFDSREIINSSLISQHTGFTSTDNMPVDSTTHRVIELNGGNDWQARLVGSWTLEKQQLSFQPGEFVTALNSGITSITLNNPPSGSPDFKRFLADMAIHQGVYHGGRLEASLPDGFKLEFTQLISFPDKGKYLTFNLSSDLPPACHALNQETLSTCRGHYRCDEQTKELILIPGLIQQHKGLILALYLTDSISPQAWLTLLEGARRYQTRLSISLAPDVTLPDELEPPPAVSSSKLPQQSHTPLFVCNQPWLVRHPDGAIVIDISEVDISDLLPSINGRLNPDKNIFEFTQQSGFLLHALADNKTVILKGKWQTTLVQALTPLLLERSKNINDTGKLVLVSKTANDFAFMIPQVNTLEIIARPNPVQLTTEYETRLDAVNQMLAHSPFVFLAGATGVGKTHFIDMQWKNQHPACHYGIDQLTQWLTDTRSGIKTLFIDEANITSRQWSMFEGLYNQSPGIFHQGIYYPLTSEHKIIFAGNPLSYGGERQLPTFFKHHHCQVEFQPLPKAVIAEHLHLDAKTAEPILAVYDAIIKLNLDNTITPREIIMMAHLTQAAMQTTDNTITPCDIARYFAYTLSHTYIPAHCRKDFDNAFKPERQPHLPTLKLKNTLINQTNHAAIKALWHQLTLREQRQTATSGIPMTGGLGGIILEGEPGVGKSTLVYDILIKKSLKEGTDFINVPASLNAHEKETLLLEAFYEGKIAIINEINSSPMLERLLNALLEGHDLHGKAAHKSGFMLIGTQNPITFRGRVSTTRPLQHRLQTICLQGDYTENEKIKIITHLGIPHRIAVDMIAEFKQQQQHNPTRCFRDLLKTARQWVRRHPADTPPLQIQLKALPQIGQICKIISITNIERYYADLLGYTPMPLHAEKSQQLSIRKLAKTHGSTQGEVLEFNCWQRIITDMGFDSEVINFKDDIHAFTQAIKTNLQAGNLIMLAFAVNKETGHPDPDSTQPENREHAAVITGYNPYADSVSISHWGNNYVVDLVDLYHASHRLNATRIQEHYNKNRSRNQNNKADIAKYIAAESNGERESIIPAPDSGFQAKLLVVKKPDKDHLFKQRKALSSRHSQKTSSAIISVGLFATHLERVDSPERLTIRM